jgi:hypothetical protein
MTATASTYWPEQADDPDIRIDDRIDPQTQDAYWHNFYWAEPYHRPEYDYEDYAPAYCVGYIGFAQYGGCYEDAEKSLCSNWVRIKGSSRLSLEDAMLAVRAAWNHAERTLAAREAEAAEGRAGELAEIIELPQAPARAPHRPLQPVYAAA